MTNLEHLWAMVALMRAGCLTRLRVADMELEMSPMGFETKTNTDVLPPEREPTESELLFHSAGPVSDDVPAVPEALLNGIRE